MASKEDILKTIYDGGQPDWKALVDRIAKELGGRWTWDSYNEATQMEYKGKAMGLLNLVGRFLLDAHGPQDPDDPQGWAVKYANYLLGGAKRSPETNQKLNKALDDD